VETVLGVVPIVGVRHGFCTSAERTISDCRSPSTQAPGLGAGAHPAVAVVRSADVQKPCLTPTIGNHAENCLHDPCLTSGIRSHPLFLDEEYS